MPTASHSRLPFSFCLPISVRCPCPFSKKTVVGRFPEIHDAAADLFPDHGSYQDRKYPFPQYCGNNHSKHRPPVWVVRSVHSVRKSSSCQFPPLIFLQALAIRNNAHVYGFLFICIAFLSELKNILFSILSLNALPVFDGSERTENRCQKLQWPDNKRSGCFLQWKLQ